MDLQELDIGSVGVDHWIYRSWLAIQVFITNRYGIVEPTMDVRGMAIPVQSPRRVKEHRENKIKESRLGFTTTTIQELATSAGSSDVGLPTTIQPEQLNMTEMETEPEVASSSLDMNNQAIKAAAVLILKERAEEKAKEIISASDDEGKPENYDDDDESYTLRVTTGEDEFNREPFSFDLIERVREFQEAIDPNKKMIMDATIINNFPVRTTEAEFIDLSLTML